MDRGNWQRVVYSAVFLDLFGFGMIIPDFQLRAEKLGAVGWQIGVILASTFVVQFLVSPRWGKLSDRVGRKSVLLACTAFSAGGMFVYGLAGTTAMLTLSRLISGFGAANVAVAQAIVADRSDDADRVVRMGRIGAAISTGLVLGPVGGGIVATTLGSQWVGFVAGGCSLLGLLILLLGLPKAQPAAQPQVVPDEEGRPKKAVFLGLLRELPEVRAMVIVVSVAWFSLATLEGTFGRLIERTLKFHQLQFGIVFGYESLIGVVVQALLIGWIAKRMGDRALLRVAYLMQGAGLALTPFAGRFPIPSLWLFVLLAISTVYAVGSALANPTINAYCSRITPAERQGELFGLLQGSRSVGFVLGPIIGGALFDLWLPAPYLLAGLTCVIAALLVP